MVDVHCNWRIRSFVAIGDSFTEGLNDPSFADGFRGWADRLAEHLMNSEPELQYTNLAIRGKRVNEIVSEQLPRAVELAPDLASIGAGANDLLRPSGDPEVLVDMVEAAVQTLKAAAGEVIVFTGYESPYLSSLRRLRERIMTYNTYLREIAHRNGCLLVDMWTMESLRDPQVWSDTVHLSSEGHQRVAAEVCDVLGIPALETWRTPVPALPIG
jgi:lysophospholipase L1-like esterase